MKLTHILTCFFGVALAQPTEVSSEIGAGDTCEWLGGNMPAESVRFHVSIPRHLFP